MTAAGGDISLCCVISAPFSFFGRGGLSVSLKVRCVVRLCGRGRRGAALSRPLPSPHHVASSRSEAPVVQPAGEVCSG